MKYSGFANSQWRHASFQAKHKTKKKETAWPALGCGGSAHSGLSADHIPSFGSLKRQQELLLGRPLTKSEATTLKNQSYTMVYESHIHQQSSRTYGGRNTRDKQMNDALDPVNAIKKDIEALSPMLLNKGYSREDINNAQLNLLSKFGVNVKSESKSSSIRSPYGP